MAAEMIIDIRRSFPSGFVMEIKLGLTLEASTVLVLFGPSGSGKTTLLRCLAGLDWPDAGHIQFISRTWVDTAAQLRVPPQDREVGYMAQDYALFPHYSVKGNIGFGLGGLPIDQRERRIAEVVRLLQLQGLEQRKPRELSGGQQQRVALARAIARRPLMLLLDEPLSALDAPTRLRLRGELRSLLKELSLPSIIVTHDWEDALALGDRMAVISGGRVLQTGTPQEVFSRPIDAEVAKIVGVDTVVQGHVLDRSNGLATIAVAQHGIKAVDVESVGRDVFVCIRAEDVVLERVGTGTTSARNHLNGTVEEICFSGPFARVVVDCGFRLAAMVTNAALEDLRLQVGTPVVAAIKAGAVHLVRRDAAS